MPRALPGAAPPPASPPPPPPPPHLYGSALASNPPLQSSDSLEVKQMQGEWLRVWHCLAQFFESSFCIETSPFKVSKWCMLELCLNLTIFLKEELSIQLAVLFCNDVRRKPSKQDINVCMLLAKITWYSLPTDACMNRTC